MVESRLIDDYLLWTWECFKDSENSQNENLISLPTDCTTRNIKVSHSDGREMIPDGNIDLHKETMNTGKGNYRVNV